MKDYKIEIGFSYSNAASQWYDEKERKLIRDKIADLLYETLKREVGDFFEIDGIDKSLTKGEMTIYVG